MGEFVRATRPEQRPLPPGPQAHDRLPAPSARPSDGPSGPQWSRLARWLRPGAHTSVGGQLISGGMIYLGRRLVAACGGRLEPALIDPDLDLAGWQPETDTRDLGYWPSYDRIPPASRAAYLRWLAAGRRAPGVPIGYVFLFFYGLERRLLHDIAADPTLRTEVPDLAVEVRGLLGAYGAHASFRRYAKEFLNLLELVDAPGVTNPDLLDVPDLTERRWPPPMTLRRALGAFAVEGRPVPPAWALAWSWYHPDIALRTPAVRCKDEFARLFERRYADAHGEGLVLVPGSRTLRVEYQPASAGLRRAVFGQPDLPDVFLAEAPSRQLAALAGGVSEDLGAYSRWVRERPDQHGTLAAAGLLPAELVVCPRGRALHPDVAAFQGWVEHHLCGADLATIDADDLIAWWPTATAGVLTKREAGALARLLGHLGLGLEPDVRLGGPAPVAGQSAVVFRTGADAPPVGSEAYAGAVTFAQLALALAGGDADDQTGNDQTGNDPRHDARPGDDHGQRLVAQASAALHLGEVERIRLRAHLRWLATTSRSSLAVLTRRLDRLSAHLRAQVGTLLVTTATADGTVLPHQVTGLVASYRRLGLDPATVPNRLHASLTSTSTAAPTAIVASTSTAASASASMATSTDRARPAVSSGPVTVRPGGADAGDYTLPPRPPEETAPPASPADSLLDGAAIEAKRAETAAVAALLHDIFVDAVDDADRTERADAADRADHAAAVDAIGAVDPRDPDYTMGRPQVESVAGLDAPHSALLRALAERESWPQDEFERVASGLGLLPAGALDVLNDAALEATDDLVLTGDGDLEIDADVLQELLA